MEGVMVSAVTGLTTLLERKYNLTKGARKEIASLGDEMSSMNALLVKLSGLEELDVQDKEWRDKVRELSYAMEDCIDMFKNGVDSADAKSGILKFIEKLKVRYKSAKLIQDLKAQVVEISDRRDRYRFAEHISCPRGLVTADARRQLLYAEPKNLVGIDDPKENLIKLLRIDETPKLEVIPVLGLGGMGKTTLAYQVYTQIKDKFTCTAFVSVSQTPDMIKILSEILRKLGGFHSGSLDVSQFIDKIRELLEHKRYLIFIDDIWTKEAWDTIKCCFLENNLGSRVITTTRIEDIARACCFGPNSHVYKMEPLNVLHSRRLFYGRIFHSEEACPDHLKNVSEEILQKCDGVPLAILSVASILATDEKVNSKETWEKIQNYFCFHLEGNYHLQLMKHVLNLGYNDLSLELKNCMLYLGLFQEDSEIMKDDLVKRWIAEGLITEKHGYGPEEIAESHFNELINRNMIQIAAFDDCGHVLSCRLHDLMFNFILLKSKEENFISVKTESTVDDILHRTESSLRIRRLSFQVKNSATICAPEERQFPLSQLRSFNFWGPAEMMTPLSNFQVLRVLFLDFPGICVRAGDMSCIRRLFRLRYLSIKGYFVGEHVLELPSTLWYVIVPSSLKLRGEFGRMKELRSFEEFYIDLEGAKSMRGLGDLSNLREVKLVLSRSSYSEGTRCFLLSALCRLRSLQSLIVRGPTLSVPAIVSSYYRDVLACWSPPPCHLHRLHVLDCPFSVLPDWIAQLDKLRSLEVEVASLPRDGTDVLARLTSLEHLRLHVGMHAPGEGVLVRSASFPNLKDFWFQHEVPCLIFDAGAMPMLERLTIQCYARAERRDDGMLDGIQHLGSLKHFTVLMEHVDGFGRPMLIGGGPSSSTGSSSQPEQQESIMEKAFSAEYRKEKIKHPRSPDMKHAFLRASLWRHVEEQELATPWDEESLEAALRNAINKHPRSADVSITFHAV